MSQPAPMLRAHRVRTLEDRVNVLRDLVWGRVIDPRTGKPDPTGSLRDPLMRRIGLLVTQHCPPRNDLCELKAVFDFSAQNVRYTGDIAGKDTFSSALRTLQFGGEDCDGHAVLNVVLAMENGFFTKFRITSNTGASWDHIYALAGVPKHRPTRWVVLDTTLGPGRFMREPPSVKRVDFDVSKGER